MAVHVLQELGQGDSSHFAPYLHMLPQQLVGSLHRIKVSSTPYTCGMCLRAYFKLRVPCQVQMPGYLHEQAM